MAQVMLRALHASTRKSFTVQLTRGLAIGDPVPVNFKKTGEDPVIKEDSAYPSWLWEMTLPSLGELQAKDSNGQELTPKETRRLFQLKSTAKIKENNELSRS
mmetsp:Transcript_26914/g.60165  ORF Transcript_26914/g.60165 Transcript_26914/m.60165 type:complete len:102 (-) Transcript_26914:468-773(-)